MNGRTGVLITRPEPDATETAAAIRDLGLVPIVAPLMTVKILPLKLAENCAAIIVSSGNALRALPPELHATPLLAVGHRTAARAQAAGFGAVASADGDAAALVALTVSLCPRGATVLLPTGGGQGEALATALRDAGYRVHRRTAYLARSVPVFPKHGRAALAAGTVRAVMFLSAETARAFAHLTPLALRPGLADIEALVISEQAAEPIAHLPWRCVRVSAKPTLERVLALL